MKAPSKKKIHSNDNFGARLVAEGTKLDDGRILKNQHFVVGDELERLFRDKIESQNVVVNEDEELVRYASPDQSLQVPLDMPTFIYYYMTKYKFERPVILADLNEDERANQFIKSTSERKRHEVKAYIS